MKKRPIITVFNLSFLDIMSCGFGAVVLVFLIINHSVSRQEETQTEALRVEAERLQSEISLSERELRESREREVVAVQTLDQMTGQTQDVAAQISRIRQQLLALQEASLARERDAASLRSDVEKLDKEKNRLQAAAVEQDKSQQTRDISGDGIRQYLTGLRIDGRHILLLLDRSASMLDNTIVNVVRRRNLPEDLKKGAEKWQRALRTLEWLIAFLPQDREFQVYAFNTQARPLLAETEGKWIQAGDALQVGKLIEEAKKLVPEDGTSLVNAMVAIGKFSPPPDSIVLITDGLPTQGRLRPAASTVSGRERLSHFNASVREIPRGIPVNIILFPMEGDPLAASAFWQLAMVTMGSYISPAEDWP